MASTAVDRTTKRLRRAARAWSAIIILLGILIFVGEIFEARATDPNSLTILSPFEYLIPTTLLLSVVGLALAWLWEGHGGLLTLACVLINLGIYWALRGHDNLRGALVVTALLTPIAIPAAMFVLCWLRSRPGTPPQKPA